MLLLPSQCQMTCRQEVGQKYAAAEQEVAYPKEEPAVAAVTSSAKEEMLSVFSGRRAEERVKLQR